MKTEIALPDAKMPQLVAVQAVQQLVEGMTVTDTDTRDGAAALLQNIVKRKDELEALRFSFTRPIDALKKQVMETFGKPADAYAQAERTLKGKIVAYDNEQERLRREQEAAARRAQEEEAERIRKAAEAQAKKTRDPEKKAAILERAEVEAQNVQAPVPVAPAVPTTEGLSSRQVWKGKGEDLAKTVAAAAAGDTLAMACLQYNDVVIGQQARSLKAAAKIPGVKVWSENSLAVSRS